MEVTDAGDAGVDDAVDDLVGDGAEAGGEIRTIGINSTSGTASSTPAATTSFTSTALGPENPGTTRPEDLEVDIPGVDSFESFSASRVFVLLIPWTFFWTSLCVGNLYPLYIFLIPYPHSIV